MGRVEGKVALVTGGARAQGRAHAVTLAREGASVVAIDICDQIPGVEFKMATQADLDETVRLIEEQDRRCVGIKADVRSPEQMQDVIDRTIEEFGRVDVVVANHGIAHFVGWEQTTADVLRDSLETNLIGVFNAVRPAIPHMIEQGGGSIIITSSTQGIAPNYSLTAYIAAKHGAIGLMRALSAELAEYWIRVNAVLPGFTRSGMTDNPTVWKLMNPSAGQSWEDLQFPGQSMHLLPTPWQEPQEMANAVLFLASDEAKHITGVPLPVDMGQLNQPPGVPPIASRRIAELEQELAALKARMGE
jgi:(+)-trans-carveol dehydrogenase